MPTDNDDAEKASTCAGRELMSMHPQVRMLIEDFTTLCRQRREALSRLCSHHSGCVVSVALGAVHCAPYGVAHQHTSSCCGGAATVHDVHDHPHSLVCAKHLQPTPRLAHERALC